MVYYKPAIGAGDDKDLKYEALVIGRNIRYLRIQKGISAKDLAEQIGMKKSTVSNYENARSVPRCETLKKIADVLGVSVERLRGVNTRQFKSPWNTYMDGRIPYFDDISHCISPDMMPDAAFPPIGDICDENSFAVKINSDDFEDLNVFDGAIVLFGSEGELLPNKILAVNIDEAAYLARIEKVGEKEVKIRVYEDGKESCVKTISVESDIILGIAVMYTAFI